MQRTEGIAARLGGIRGIGGGARVVGIDLNEAVQARLFGFDLAETGLDDLAGGNRARRNRVGRFDQRTTDNNRGAVRL